jgi:hypothetical protein
VEGLGGLYTNIDTNSWIKEMAEFHPKRESDRHQEGFICIISGFDTDI